MKITLLKFIASFALICSSTVIFAQVPELGTAASFALFTSAGSVTNSSPSHITGNVGSASAAATGFGNVNGVMHNNDLAAHQAAEDLLIAYNQLNSRVHTDAIAPSLGGGQILEPGTYLIGEAAVLNLELILDAKGDADAIFIFKIQGAFSTNANSMVSLINRAQACNVFWKVEGLVDMAALTTMKGTVIANNAAINMGVDGKLEGRLLSTTGAVSVGGILANTPSGCNAPVLKGALAPELGSAACFTLLTGNGELTNEGVTIVKGDIGTNVGLTTGFNADLVDGDIHAIPDNATAAAASDLNIAYDYLNLLGNDITLLYPAEFGNGLVLTPHTYLLDAATVLTDTLYLNAQGVIDAVFVIKINGALSTLSNSKVILTNGTQAKNVFWKVEGAVTLETETVFVGTMVINGGAFGALKPGTNLNGRILATGGALVTSELTAKTEPANCLITGYNTFSTTNNPKATIAPNPFNGSTTVILTDDLKGMNNELRVYNSMGSLVIHINLVEKVTALDTNLVSGVYTYQILDANGLVQAGKLVSE